MRQNAFSSTNEKFILSKRISLPLFFVFFLIICSSIPTKAKEGVDPISTLSTRQFESDSAQFAAFKNYYQSHIFNAPDSVIKLTDFHFEAAKSLGDKREMLKALDQKAFSYYVLGNPENGLIALTKAETIANELKDPILIAKNHSHFASTYASTNKFKEAYKRYSKSLKIFQEEGNELLAAKTLGNLAIIHYDLDNYDKAIEDLHQSVQILEKFEEKENLIRTLGHLGNAHLKKGDYENALEYLYKSMSKMQPDEKSLNSRFCFTALANTYYGLGQIDSALLYNQKSLVVNEAIGNEALIIDDKILYSKLIFEEDIEKATAITKELEVLIENSSDNTHKMLVYEMLAECYKSQGQHEPALLNHEKFIHFKDIVEKEKGKTTIIRESIKDLYEQKLSETQLEKETLKRNHLLTQIIFGLGSLGVILLIFFGARTKLNSQNKEKEALLIEIDQLKKEGAKTTLAVPSGKFELNRQRIEGAINKKLNETDWNVLKILLDDPVISNKGIAEKAFLTPDGIGSSLRRMYVAFDIKESKYKKISLLMEAVKHSNYETA